VRVVKVGKGWCGGGVVWDINIFAGEGGGAGGAGGGLGVGSWEVVLLWFNTNHPKRNDAKISTNIPPPPHIHQSHHQSHSHHILPHYTLRN